jgi:hypothetical protein
MTARADRGLLAELDGHQVLAGRANRRGLTLLTRERRAWPRRPGREREPGDGRPGSRLVAAGGILLFLLGGGLLTVSYAAQYRYVLDQRHQVAASLIEAAALDVGLVIFSLLALGLARAGLPAKVERALIIVCALGSAVMNYAAADVTSPRSVLAFCMPPVFLAVVVDRVAATTRRHVLGMREGRSPWTVLGTVVLYGLRFVLAAPSTCAGLRRAILAATPLPASAQPEHNKPGRGKAGRERRQPPPARGDTKTARFLRLVATGTASCPLYRWIRSPRSPRRSRRRQRYIPRPRARRCSRLSAPPCPPQRVTREDLPALVRRAAGFLACAGVRPVGVSARAACAAVPGHDDAAEAAAAAAPGPWFRDIAGTMAAVGTVRLVP